MYDIKNLNIWKKEETKTAPAQAYLQSDLSELNLPLRAFHCLKRAGCSTVGDVISLMENDDGALRRIRNLGAKSEEDIKEALELYRKQFPDDAQTNRGGKMRRTLIRPARQVWDSSIRSFRLSQRSLAQLEDKGIHTVRDLYDTDPEQEPGWYAVRELLEKIADSAT